MSRIARIALVVAFLAVLGAGLWTLDADPYPRPNKHAGWKHCPKPDCEGTCDPATQAPVICLDRQGNSWTSTLECCCCVPDGWRNSYRGPK